MIPGVLKVGFKYKCVIFKKRVLHCCSVTSCLEDMSDSSRTPTTPHLVTPE